MRGQRECKQRRYEVGRRRVKGLKVRVGQECCISRGEPHGPAWTVEVYKLEKSEKKDTVLVGVEIPKQAGKQQGG